MLSTVILLILGFGIPFIYFYLSKNPQFGARLSKGEKETFQKSKHWKKGKFQNLTKTTMDIKLGSVPGLIKENIKGKKSREPVKNIPILPFRNDVFKKEGRPKFIWYGHATLLLQIEGVNILIDPMFGPDASPIGPVRTRRFSGNSLQVMRTLPPVGLILFTHDHYDHLDFESMRYLSRGASKFLVPLGVGRHLLHWGISKDRITEFDWWDEIDLLGLELIFTPSRHFSGRGLFDRSTSLWGGWVIKNEKHRIYWSGDGGYGDHFKVIGEKFGPFDWGFLECGQYNERWHQIHMYPEEAVKVANEVRVQTAIPFHWGAFSLALHHWTDPVERFVSEAKRLQQAYLCPRPGEVITMGHQEVVTWWEDYT